MKRFFNQVVKIIKYTLKMACALAILVSTLLALFGAGISNSWSTVLFALLIVAATVYAMIHSTKTFLYKPRQFNPNEMQPIIPVGLSLHTQEVCWLQKPVGAAKSKEVTTGYIGRSSGMSVRFAKGITVHTGGNRGTPIRRTIMEKYSGTLYITSQRIVIVAAKYGFDKKLSSLTSATCYKDALDFQFGSTVYTAFMKEPLYVHGLLNAVISTYNK